MRNEAAKRIGYLYPRVKLIQEYGGGEATVIAWLWARTVTCPNPACGARMPLVRSFGLSTKYRPQSLRREFCRLRGPKFRYQFCFRVRPLYRFRMPIEIRKRVRQLLLQSQGTGKIVRGEHVPLHL